MNPKLRVINLGALGQTQNEAPLPLPDGALYRHPNPDGSRKSCKNCILFVASEDACTIHAREVNVESTDVCGFHVFGQPMKKWIDYPGIQPVTPDLSGLQPAGPGVACASCVFYRGVDLENGICVGVSRPEDRKPGVPVKALGWCARYEPM